MVTKAQKATLEASVANTSNIDHSEIAEKARGFGARVGDAERAKLDAGIYFGELVRTKVLKSDDAPQFTKWYDEGACMKTGRAPMAEKSLGVVSSKFKGFAHESVLTLVASVPADKPESNPYTRLAAFVKGKDRKTQCGGKDLFEAATALNAGIKTAAADNKPLALDSVTDSYIATRLAKKAAVEATPQEKLAAAKQALIDDAKAIRDAKGISKAQKEALNSMIAALSI